MMLQIRKSSERGYFDHGWLKTCHTFSFADYHDPNFMGFKTLRVINEDYVAAGQGFPTHSHRDMEIITYILEGALEHKDSMGNTSVIRPNEVQRMTAGTGVTHSEFNHSKQDQVHFLQIWILPNARSLSPGYEQKRFDRKERRGRFRLIASVDGRVGSTRLHQDVLMSDCSLEKSKSTHYSLAEKRGVWIQLVKGSVMINGLAFEAGDGAFSEEPGDISFEAMADSELILFDLA